MTDTTERNRRPGESVASWSDRLEDLDTRWDPFVEQQPPTLVSDDPAVRAAWEGSRFFHNNRYHVVMREYEEPGKPKLIHLSIRDADRSTRHDWRDFQRIKNELIGTDEEAVELYPAESRLVDTSNQYHLWCVVGMTWPFGFEERMVWTAEEAAQANPDVRQREGAGEYA